MFRQEIQATQEVLTDFTNYSRLLYIESFNAVAGAGFVPWLEDKPVTSFAVNAARFPSDAIFYTPRAIGREELLVQPLRADQVDEPYFDIDYSLETPTQEVLDYRAAIRRPASEAVAAEWPGLSARLLPGTVRAEYIGYYQDEKTTTAVDSWDILPSFANLKAATRLAVEALVQVKLEGLVKKTYEQIYSESSKSDVISVSLDLQIDSSLPLSGHEPKEFLERFVYTMQTRAKEAGSILEAYLKNGSEPEGVEYYLELRDKNLAAARRALALISR